MIMTQKELSMILSSEPLYDQIKEENFSTSLLAYYTTSILTTTIVSSDPNTPDSPTLISIILIIVINAKRSIISKMRIIENTK